MRIPRVFNAPQTALPQKSLAQMLRESGGKYRVLEKETFERKITRPDGKPLISGKGKRPARVKK